jgi:hypothetical protein
LAGPAIEPAQQVAEKGILWEGLISNPKVELVLQRYKTSELFATGPWA